MSRPLITPCVNSACLVQMDLTVVRISGGMDRGWRAWRISVARSLSWVLVLGRASLKRSGEGVEAGEGRPALGMGGKRVEARGLVVGVVKMSVSVFVAPEVGVGHAVALSRSNSSRVRFPGVDSRSVFMALRGVSGGGIALLESSSATLVSSSSSLRGQS